MNRGQSIQWEKCASIGWCEKFAQEAKYAKMWINIGNKWFTPDEFVKYAYTQTQSFAHDLTKILEADIKMRDPRPVIPRLEKRFDQIQKEKDDFIKRVNDFYK